MKDVKIGDHVRWWFKCGGEEKSCAGRIHRILVDHREEPVEFKIFTITGMKVTVLIEDIIRYMNFGGKIE
jgi:hypothetical protein